MELKYQGLTNSQRFISRNNDCVEIEKAYNFYMQSQQTTISNLKCFINMENKDEALNMLKTQMENFTNMYYTLFEAYKDKKAI